MIKKLKTKFVCFTMAIVTVLLCVILGLTVYFTHENLETESLQAMQRLASEHFIPGRPGERPNDLNLPYFSLMIGSKGEALDINTGSYDLSDTALLSAIVNAALSKPEKTGILPDYSLRFLKTPAPGGQRLVFADISGQQATVSNLIRICVFIGILSLVVFFIISLLLARWAVRPVEKAWQQQRQFVADASHELKTPLTVITTNAELLQNPEYDPAQQQQFATSILTMSRQMRGLVEGLLDLARADNGSTAMEFSLMDYSELIGDSILPFEPLFFEQGLLLQCSIDGGIRLSGSASHLRQVLDILLDNAAKYSLPDSTVTVSLKRQGRHCILAVSNSGEAISREDLKNIFKRFYRIDKARAMNRSYGLGLPIAEGIIKEHQGKIWAQSENGCNTFFVQLPVIPE